MNHVIESALKLKIKDNAPGQICSFGNPCAVEGKASERVARMGAREPLRRLQQPPWKRPDP